MIPDGIEERRFFDINGLDVFALCAGRADAPGGLILLLHGFPELSFSWRKVMLPLADAGYFVVAPDLRGYGNTTGWSGAYDVDLEAFAMPNLVRDVSALLDALGCAQAACVVGHDFGSPLAAYCALTLPERFRSVVLMSAPFAGPPRKAGARAHFDHMAKALAALDPPRMHYQSYYSEARANAELLSCDVHRLLRGYYHGKSADWSGNQPEPLISGAAEQMARLPLYYVMRQDENMAQTADRYYADYLERGGVCAWLSDEELEVYAAAYTRAGFQGGLNWYRCVTGGVGEAEWIALEQRVIEMPSLFIAGSSDWGIYQTPGAFEAMQARALSDLRATVLIDGAGHWVQQEQPEKTLGAILDFLR